MRIDQAALAYGTTTVPTKRGLREAVAGSSAEGDSRSAAWLNRAVVAEDPPPAVSVGPARKGASAHAPRATPPRLRRRCGA
eukprot:3177314-Pyramimonas_sp.AAC.1